MDSICCGPLFRLIAGQPAPGSGHLLFNTEHISFTAINRAACRLADAMQNTGVQPGQHVGVLLERHPDVLTCMLAIWKLGAVYIPFDPQQPRARLHTMVENSDIAWLITRQNNNELHFTLACRNILLLPVNYQNHRKSDFRLFTPPEPQQCAYIFHTSGSTGTPKGVAVSFASLEHVLVCVMALLDLSKADTILALANFSFDISLFELLAAPMSEGTVMLLDDDNYRDPAQIQRAVLEKQVSVLQATPSLWQLLTDLAWPQNYSTVKALGTVKALSTGEALTGELARKILAIFPQLWNLYGPTETTIWATVKKLDPEHLPAGNNYVAIGQALPGYDCLIPEEAAGNGPAQSGELYIAGKGLALAYYNDSALTDERFVRIEAAGRPPQRYYRSGDLCRQDVHREFNFIGRLDKQIKIHGYRIEPEEIEQALEQHACINRAAVVPVKLPDGRSRILAAWIVFENGMPNKTTEKITAFLRRKLPAYMLPQRYLFIDALPLDRNAKLDRKQLASHFPRSCTGEQEVFDSSIEQNLASMFCRILGIPKIGRFDSFFDHGGNSMLAATLLMTVNNEYATTITLKHLLQTPPTVYSVCRLLRQARARTAGAEGRSLSAGS